MVCFQLPPTVDLPDYFGEGEDEGEFLLKDEPTTLPLLTVQGRVAVGALQVHFYYGTSKRPFIAPKEAQTDPHLVSVISVRGDQIRPKEPNQMTDDILVNRLKMLIRDNRARFEQFKNFDLFKHL